MDLHKLRKLKFSVRHGTVSIQNVNLLCYRVLVSELRVKG